MNLKAYLYALLLGLVSCGLNQEEPKKRNFDDENVNAATPECRKSEYTGCMQGQVVAAPDIYVGGQKFFDANSFAAKFKDMLEIKGADGKKLDNKDIVLTWATKLDNKSFLQDFEVYLKGSVAQQANVMRNGAFVFHRLADGSYDLRVQKTFEVKLSTAAKAPLVEQNATDTQPEAPALSVAKTYCVTLFSELTLDIKRNVRTTGIVLDRFDYEVKTCGESQAPESISL